MRMANLRKLISLYCIGVFLFWGCSTEDDGAEKQVIEKPTEETINLPDLSTAVEKRIEGKLLKQLKFLGNSIANTLIPMQFYYSLQGPCQNQSNLP